MLPNHLHKYTDVYAHTHTAPETNELSSTHNRTKNKGITYSSSYPFRISRKYAYSISRSPTWQINKKSENRRGKFFSHVRKIVGKLAQNFSFMQRNFRRAYGNFFGFYNTKTEIHH